MTTNARVYAIFLPAERSFMVENKNSQNILSSWKEIANYLKLGTRTCTRWEEKYGLPVHRIEGQPGGTVFAYKDEIDRWMEAKLKNHTISKIPDARPAKLLRYAVFALPMVAGLCFLIFILVKGKGTPPKNEPKAAGVPRSSGPLPLKDLDIVTAEFGGAGTLRLWHKNKTGDFQETWKINPVRHSSVAIGNLDNKGGMEIVAAGVCQEVEDRGDRQVSAYRFFLNVYKPGVDDWWKTTFYSKKDCVFEDDNSEITEIAIGDVDGLPGNEVILQTATGLGVFRYDKVVDEFRLLRSRNRFMDDKKLFLKSVAVANIDEDPAEEIILVGDELTDQGTAINKGWLIIFKVREGWPEIHKAVPIDGNFAFQSLRVGDVIAGGSPEIVSPIYRNANDMWNSYIIIWNAQGEKVNEQLVFNKEDYQYKVVHLDVGNLTPHPGDEIVLGHNSPSELRLYSWNGSGLIAGPSYSLGHKYATTTNLYIVDADQRPDSYGDVVVCGASYDEVRPGQSGKFYLEVFGYNDGFVSKWSKIGGDAGMIRASYAAINKLKK
jgi:hypothetical protein